jgi:hypothetical protein
MMMKPGERVTLIRQLAEALEKFDITDADLMLRQFGFRWQQHWSGDLYSYFVEMLESGDDSALLQLHEHMFGFSGESPESDMPAFWRLGGLRVFISHLAITKAFAAELKADLAQYGINAFVAHEDIEPTKEWVDEIEAGLSTCDALVALLTPGFKESNWTDQEVGFCHGRRVLIVSVRQGLDPYGFISRYQAVNGNGKAGSDVASELVRIFAKNPKTASATAESLVHAFERSDSFAAAKYRVANLSMIESWTPDLLRRIEQAADDNGQINGSWGVPGQVTRILKDNGGARSTSPPAAPTVSPFDADDD